MVNSILSLPAAANRYVLRTHDWMTANSLSNSTLRKISPTWESLGLASRKVSLGEKYYAISGGRNEVSPRGPDDCKHWGRHSGCTIAGQLSLVHKFEVRACKCTRYRHHRGTSGCRGAERPSWPRVGTRSRRPQPFMSRGSSIWCRGQMDCGFWYTAPAKALR